MADQQTIPLRPAEAPDTSGKVPEQPESPASREGSLTDDITALLDDGKTYVEAEIQFQKTRASFALDRGRSGALYGVVALTLLWLALVALVVGSLIALIPVLGAWGATALVAGLLAVAGVLAALAARKRFKRLSEAYRGTKQ